MGANVAAASTAIAAAPSQGARLEQEQIERRDIPQRRKAAEIAVRRLHPPVGEIERAGHRDDEAERQRRGWRQQPAGGDGIGRHEHVGRKIDDEIEQFARPARQQLRHPQPPRQGAVDAVDDERQPKPKEHARPLGAHRRHQRQQRAGSAAGGKDVDRKSGHDARSAAGFAGGSVGSILSAYTGMQEIVRKLSVIANLSTYIRRKRIHQDSAWHSWTARGKIGPPKSRSSAADRPAS